MREVFIRDLGESSIANDQKFPVFIHETVKVF